MIRNSPEGYGTVARVLHWGMAIGIIAVFALGVWMVELDYYSPYYNSAPDLHRSVGMLLFGALAVRMAWRQTNLKPDRTVLTKFERQASRLVHAAFYVLLVVLMMSGYLISTSDGRPIAVFNWFSVPSLAESKGLEVAAGLVHEWVSYAVMALTAVHAAAAVKHRFFDSKTESNRMW